MATDVDSLKRKLDKFMGVAKCINSHFSGTMFLNNSCWGGGEGEG